jgi:xanthine dehydrogenase YagR molybdenum-binding subunit
LPLERSPPLSDLTAQHVGQHMAVVVADTPENATYATSLFDLDYESGESDAAGRSATAAIYRTTSSSSRRRGFKTSAVQGPSQRSRLGSARFTTPVASHYPIELSSTIAWWDGDALTVHDSTRWITGERRALAACLAIAESRIRILSPLAGGAFGAKSFLWMRIALCATAARAVNRPVKLVLTRNQMFTSTGHRPRTVQDVVLIADTDGLIGSTEHHTRTETSTVADFCEPAGLSTRFLYHSPRQPFPIG